MKRILSFFAVLCGLSVQAQKPEVIPPFTGISLTGAELYVYRHSGSGTSPVVVIFPGGGYQNLAMDHEGHQMAAWYVENGFTAIVVKYRMPEGKHEIPLFDAEKTIATVRAGAERFGIDPKRVFVVGSSAGGHLVASLCNLAEDANRPDFAILYYPVISFEDGVTHEGSKRNLLGERVGDKALVERYSLDRQVSAKTPPTLLLLSDDDKAVIPENSLRYYAALKRSSVPASMHIFPTGGHGWGFNASFAYQEAVKEIIAKWTSLQLTVDN